ncbi:MAG TPA: class I SAM-dependent methyltransferase, partial [Anaerolineae bacterium]
YERIDLAQKRIQEVDLAVFESMQPNDILFVDSTHVSKTGSDVNWILFQVLPRLQSGVYIQFHDIFYPFEYPPEWVMHGRAWNELYLLRAFLACNERYKIVLFNSFLQQWAKPTLNARMSACLKTIGGSLWLRKL